MNIVDRQTFVISINCDTFNDAAAIPIPSRVILPMTLRFPADEIILKSISYHPVIAGGAVTDIDDVIQIWCNITNDNLIGAFPNTNCFCYQHNEHFRINNTFQNGNFELQLLGTDGSINNVPNYASIASYNPQRFISSQVPLRTKGTVILTIEFVKLAK